MCGKAVLHSFFMSFLLIATLVHVGNAADSAITHDDIAVIKTYVDSFNQSRNYQTPSGPAEQYCWTSGTFLAYQPCDDIPTCTLTANLVCTVSGGSCMVDVLAIHILAYKNGVDRLNAAYSSFMTGYESFSTNNIEGSLDQMDSAFDAMKTAADEQGQSKLRLPDQIPCPCTNTSDCCIGRCPEAHFNYTAITDGKARISDIRLKNCFDGTQGGQCSVDKPLECVLGKLANNSYRCGCPSGMKQKGNACEMITCTDNGVVVPNLACSNKTIGNKCQNGTLIFKPTDCGCPAGQYLSGETCLCPIVTSKRCNITNVTKSHDVTYNFDRGYRKIVEESYTFEKMHCYSVLSSYEGVGCFILVNETVNETPVFISPDPQMPSAINVTCGRCPDICTREPPVNLTCGDCSCPFNLGFCDANGKQMNITGALAYCENELLKSQKKDGADCVNGYECKTNECRDSKCYNRQNDLLQLFIDWVQGLFGIRN